MDAPEIRDYAVIGNGRSAALASRFGSIDWLCWPVFDSPALFAALLDPAAGGSWRIAPAAPARASRRYLEDTNVLETRFHAGSGTLVLTDLMTVAAEEEKKVLLLPENEIVRRAACESGEVEIEVAFAPRPDFARRCVPIRDAGALGLRLDMGSKLVTLRGEVGFALRDDGTAVARIGLRAGEARHFSLTWSEEAPAVLPPLGDFTREAIARTGAWWRNWVRRATYAGPYRDAVVRSALALKLLGYAPSGAIVAAPTASLPERIGGSLNWDYRFCWLRDAAFIARALFGLGYEEDAHAYISWLLHTTRLSRPELRVLYDVYGRVISHEEELAHLAGYRGSRPVRIGNAAGIQFQLDIYGEVIEAAARFVREDGRLDRETQEMLAHFGEYVCRHWEEPDNGIWEIRGARKPFTHSRVLCWTALDRLLEMHRRGAVARIPADMFRKNREAIRREVEERGFNSGIGSYTQTVNGNTLDASLLLIPWYGFEDASSPRMRGTFRKAMERLSAGPGLIYRYEQSREDGEGAFGICSFWAVEFLARGGGSLDEAQAAFERILPYANDVGLFAEEIDPETGEALGNFPQGFTHVGLINAALSLAERASREESEKQPRSGGKPPGGNR